jgi:hypothetical protein
MFYSAVGQHLDAPALRRRVHRAQESAALRPLRLHDLRHSFGSLCRAEVDPTTQKARMGHANSRPSSTRMRSLDTPTWRDSTAHSPANVPRRSLTGPPAPFPRTVLREPNATGEARRSRGRRHAAGEHRLRQVDDHGAAGGTRLPPTSSRSTATRTSSAARGSVRAPTTASATLTTGSGRGERLPDRRKRAGDRARRTRRSGSWPSRRTSRTS